MNTATKKEIAKQDLIHALHDLSETLCDQADIMREKARLIDMVAEDVAKNNLKDPRVAQILQNDDLGKRHSMLQMKQGEITLKIVRLLTQAGYI